METKHVKNYIPFYIGNLDRAESKNQNQRNHPGQSQTKTIGNLVNQSKLEPNEYINLAQSAETREWAISFGFMFDWTGR